MSQPPTPRGVGDVVARAGLAILVACRAPAPGELARAQGGAPTVAASPATEPDPLAELRIFENAERARTDFAHPKTSDTAFGADPYVIRSVATANAAPAAAGRTRFVGVLRGRSALVELDSALHEVARWPAPESPSGLTVAANGEVFVVGELASRVARYRRVPRVTPEAVAAGSSAGGEFEPAGSIELPGVRSIRDVASGPEGVIYVVEEHDGRLLTLQPRAAAGASSAAARADSTVCHGPIHVMRVARAVLVDCLLEHEVVVRSVDRRGFPVTEGETRIVHDGPMWGLDAVEDGSGLLVAVGGVEDHPLDRTEGSFGFIDSFVTLYRVSRGKIVKLSEVNTSALGVVTPKALKFSRRAPGVLELAVASYGSDRLARLAWERRAGQGETDVPGQPTAVAIRPIPPGSRMMELAPDGSLVVANPLLDAWVNATAEEGAVVPVEDPDSGARAPASRLGEALFFTTLMAPWNKSEGRLSRFTCETCHFEGYVDGRTHHTGRGDVHATTKPLLGLLSNRPYFSRALDPDLTTMVDNEFGVAGAKSGHDPWFSLPSRDFPWLAELVADCRPQRSAGPRFPCQDQTLTPETLRRALMTFLMGFTHRPNPSVVGRAHWTDFERAGAEVFRDKCEVCHEARLVTDDPSTRVGFDKWEERVMAREGAIVWARAGYEKTGILPYVSERGARVVSLRRLYKKYPYFTNGSAKDITTVLDRVGFADGIFFHDGAPAWANRLRSDEKAELSAFVDLL